MHIFTDDLAAQALRQLGHSASLPFVHPLGNIMKIKLKTPKPRNALVAAARLRGGAGAHQSEVSPRAARRAGKNRLRQLLSGRVKDER